MAAAGTEVEPNPFELVTRTRNRPGFTIEPIAIAWNAVAFRVSGARTGVACVPRAELAAFFADLDAGKLDSKVREFLAAPPDGRVLRSADQTRSGGLFDAMASSDAIVPAERVPGRSVGLGRGGGGTPADARRRKQQRRRPRPPRRVLVGAAAATVAVVAVVATVVAVTAGGSDTKTVAVNAPSTSSAPTTPSTTATTTAPELTMASRLQGSWTVTRTVTSSNNPRQPVGQVLQLAYVITSSCVSTPCTVHVDAQGSQGAREQIDLTFAGDQYTGLVTGTTPCNSFTTGAHLGDTTLTGNMALATTRDGQFTGTLTLNIVPNAQCVGTTISYSLVATK